VLSSVASLVDFSSFFFFFFFFLVSVLSLSESLSLIESSSANSPLASSAGLVSDESGLRVGVNGEEDLRRISPFPSGVISSETPNATRAPSIHVRAIRATIPRLQKIGGKIRTAEESLELL
jgi:hypothetical protein